MIRRILILSPFPPRRDADHGGNRSIAYTIAELVPGCAVRILCLRGEQEPPTEPALAALCESVEEIRRPGQSIGVERAVLLAGSLARFHPFWVGNWRVEAFRRRAREIVRDWLPDVVHFEFQVMAQYRDAAEDRTAILIVHEAGLAAVRDRRRLCPVWQRPLLDRECSAWESYERAILPQFDAAICFSERDRSELAVLCPSIPLAVIPPPFRPAAAGPARHSFSDPSPAWILFAGNFLHPPNVDAALRLAKDIFPGVRARCPGAKLCIAGASPPARLRALASADIKIAGRVPDMQPLIAEAALIAVPLRSGSGVRVKMIEALAAGKAVVATELAAAELHLRDGEEYLRAESDSEFVESIAGLLGDASRRETLSAKAEEWGRSYCKPGRVRSDYEALYVRLESLTRCER